MNGGTEMDVSGKQSSEKRLIDYYYLAEKIECPGEPLVYWHDIEAAPTVDAVPVVRCEKCLLHGNCITEDSFELARIENPFCCAGKRKEGAD